MQMNQNTSSFKVLTALGYKDVQLLVTRFENTLSTGNASHPDIP